MEIVDIVHAANCALWLLEQPELEHLITSDWSDPEAIYQKLLNAGCVPRREREWAYQVLKNAEAKVN